MKLVRAQPATRPAKGPDMRPGTRRATWALLGAVALLCSACSAPQPWVKPYERERLADPLMQFSRTALTEKHREHVHLVREGARGATGVQGGGCGCN